MKRVLFTLLIALVTLSGFAQRRGSRSGEKGQKNTTASSSYDVRKVKWGMTMSSVKSSEYDMKPYSEGEQILRYETLLNNYSTRLSYYFAPNLRMVSYSIGKPSDTYDVKKNTFEYFRKLLVEKYGEPSANSPMMPNQTGNCEWQTPRTTITLTTYGTVVLQYAQRNFWENLDKEARQKTLEDL